MRGIKSVCGFLIVCALGFSAGVCEQVQDLPLVTMSLGFDPGILGSCLEKGLLIPTFTGEVDPSAIFVGEITMSDPDGVEMRLDVESISSCWAGVVILEVKKDSNDRGRHLRATLEFEPPIMESCLETGLIEPRLGLAEQAAVVDKVTLEDSLVRFEFDVLTLSRCWAGIVTFKAEDPERISPSGTSSDRLLSGTKL